MSTTMEVCNAVSGNVVVLLLTATVNANEVGTPLYLGHCNIAEDVTPNIMVDREVVDEDAVANIVGSDGGDIGVVGSANKVNCEEEQGDGGGCLCYGGGNWHPV